MRRLFGGGVLSSKYGIHIFIQQFFLLIELYKSRLHSRLHSYTNFNVILAGIFGVIVNIR